MQLLRKNHTIFCYLISSKTNHHCSLLAAETRHRWLCCYAPSSFLHIVNDLFREGTRLCFVATPVLLRARYAAAFPPQIFIEPQVFTPPAFISLCSRKVTAAQNGTCCMRLDITRASKSVVGLSIVFLSVLSSFVITKELRARSGIVE